jgi:hypothetical protein
MAVPELTPQETRAQDAQFVAQCSLQGLRSQLPLRWPTPPETPPSPKKSYRSAYVYPGWEELNDPANWEHLSAFDLVLRLVDFSGLRPVLAELLGWTSARGQKPFDPVSIFLLTGWQITHRWSRAQTLRNLAAPRYADYARLFGFHKAILPTEGGLRCFLTTLGRNSALHGDTVTVEKGNAEVQFAVQYLNRLLAQAIQLLHAASLFSEPTWQAALVCPDGQIHAAASRLRCRAVTATCYQPTTPQNPRPCPAKDKEWRSCDCDTLQCAQICKRAPPRDPQARYIYYSGDNQENGENEHGEEFYGYRSLPLRLADRQRRFSVTLLSDVLPANHREEDPAAALLLQLAHHYPDLVVQVVAGDAGLGFESFLHTIYAHLRARRVVAQRHHQTDENKALWPTRGYDDCGRPICNFGYAFSSNGFDKKRHRLKWICDRVCLRQPIPRIQLPNVIYPPPECPYQLDDHPKGRIFNLGERFPDGSIRLARDFPVGSPSWKALYHRTRNAVEGRNATFEDWLLKRLPVFGLPKARALLFCADVWDILTSLTRLIREATLASLAP